MKINVSAFISPTLGLILTASVGFLAIPASGCPPRVSQLHGTLAYGSTYNILILGDGFGSPAELDSYHAAAQTLATGLFEDPLFHRWQASINIYRIDVRDDRGVKANNCLSSATPVCGLHAPLPPPPVLAPVAPVVYGSGGPAIVDEDLQAELCWNTTPLVPGSCKTLWLGVDGQALAFDLALDAPDIDAVVVLANVTTPEPSGGGLQDALSDPGTPRRIGLAVMGVPVDLTTGSLGPTAVPLLAHELGHVLGLLDEYELAIGYPTVDHTDRNIFDAATAATCWTPTVGTTGAPDFVPWNGVLNCSWTLVCQCGAATASPCIQPWVPNNLNVPTCDTEAATGVAAAHACCDEWTAPGSLVAFPAGCDLSTMYPCDCHYPVDVAANCMTHPGLWEGADYVHFGKFRARFQCGMRILGMHFCEACGLVVDNTLALVTGSAPVPAGTYVTPP